MARLANHNPPFGKTARVPQRDRSWGGKARRRLLLSATALALALTICAAITPNPALAVVCESATPASNSGSDGSNSQNTACGEDSIGAGAMVLAGHTNSTAIGAGAATTRANQVMVGTSSTTYTMPGITSNASKAAQSGTTQIVTSDANGNLATADLTSLGLSSGDVSGLQSQINRLGRRDKELTEGIATIASLAQPILLPGQHFAMRAGWGGYDDANAVGLSAAGVVASDGGVGFGTSEGEVAGRDGMSFGW